jgi:hypothetical protein
MGPRSSGESTKARSLTTLRLARNPGVATRPWSAPCRLSSLGTRDIRREVRWSGRLPGTISGRRRREALEAHGGDRLRRVAISNHDPAAFGAAAREAGFLGFQARMRRALRAAAGLRPRDPARARATGREPDDQGRRRGRRLSRAGGAARDARRGPAARALPRQPAVVLHRRGARGRNPCARRGLEGRAVIASLLAGYLARPLRRANLRLRERGYRRAHVLRLAARLRATAAQNSTYRLRCRRKVNIPNGGSGRFSSTAKLFSPRTRSIAKSECQPSRSAKGAAAFSAIASAPPSRAK